MPATSAPGWIPAAAPLSNRGHSRLCPGVEDGAGGGTYDRAVSEDYGTAPTLEALRKARMAQDSAVRSMRMLGPALAVVVTLSVLRAEPSVGSSGRACW